MYACNNSIIHEWALWEPIYECYKTEAFDRDLPLYISYIENEVLSLCKRMAESLTAKEDRATFEGIM